MEALKIDEVIEKISQEAVKHNDEDRFIRTLDVNQHTRQGDLYVQRVEENYPKGKEILNSKQLAPGTTKGSRHTAEGKVRLFEANSDTLAEEPLHGPVIVAEERWNLAHPQHGDHSIPSGTYRVGYQLDPRTMRRVAD